MTPSALSVGDTCTLAIHDIALPAAFGVGRAGDLVVFVPGGVPGDTLRVRIARVEKRLAYGEVVEIEEASPFRVSPRCPHFGECEGSDLQVLAYDKQLEIKENHLRQVLRRIAAIDPNATNISPMTPSVDRYFYRSKIEFSFGRSSSGTIVGMTERLSPLHPFSGRIVPVDDCCLFSPLTGRIMETVRAFLHSSDLPAFDNASGTGFLKRLVLREGKGTSQVLVNVITASDRIEALAPLTKGLIETGSEVKSVYAGQRPILLGGGPYIEEHLAGLVLRVYPLSFFQPNPKTAEELYRRIIPAAGISGSERVLGLYCGAGSIELFLSRHVREVTGIDSSAESIACAKENAAANGIGNATFVRAKAEEAARRYRGKGVDMVVIDPPRSGMSREALSAVRTVGAVKLVYVSCNPSTLARDLKLLAPDYAIAEMAPFDFFPQTAHFEVLTVLEKRHAL